MTKLYTDFSEYTTGVAPSDWTRHFGTRSYTVKDAGDATGGKVLELSGAADYDFFVWNAINADSERADSEVLFRFRVIGQSSEIRALQRGSDNSGRDGYILGSRPQTGSWNYSKLGSGNFSDGPNNTDINVTNNEWWFCSSVVRGGVQELRLWPATDPRPTDPRGSGWSDTSISAAGWIGLYSNRDDTVEIDFFAVGTGTDDAPLEAVDNTPTLRKSSTFDIETELSGTITDATLDGNAITVDSQDGTTVTLTDSDGSITTSGEYDLVLTDDSADPDETITVQVNVYGVVPSNNPLQKDGSALADLTNVEVRVTDGANINGTELYYSGTATTDASGNLSNIDLSSTAAEDADPVLLHLRTAAGDSIIASETVGLI